MTTIRNAHTRAELLAIVMILAFVTLVAIAIPRISRNSAAARTRTCRTNVGLMNTQIEAYFSEYSCWPAALTDIIDDPNYFPEGVPVCPAGGYYSVDDASHRVSCNTHSH